MYDLNHRLNQTPASHAGKKISASRGKLLGDVTMKMVKKILLGLAATAAVIGLASCADVAGAGKATGTKTNKTITVDGKGLFNYSIYNEQIAKQFASLTASRSLSDP